MSKQAYPPTRRAGHIDKYHGIQVQDPYRWLEALNEAEVQDWIEAQNAVTFGYLEEIPERESIRQRLTALWDYPKVDTPFRRAEKYFQFRNSGLQNQDVLYVMPSPREEGRVLIDPNAFSEDGTVALTGLNVSWDGAWVAYATSASGSDWKTWHVRNVETGEDLPDTVAWSKFSQATWLPDNSGFFYGRYAVPAEGSEYAEANYNQQVYLHRLHTSQRDDVLIYERPDHPTWGFEPIVTDDKRYVVLLIWEGTDPRNRVFYRALDDDVAGTGPFTELIPQLEAAYEFLGNTGGEFYFLTDFEASRGRLIAIDIANPAREAWRTLAPESDDTLEHVEMVHDEFIGIYLHDAAHRLRRFALDGTPRGEIPLPGLGAVSSLHGRREHSELFYSFSSFIYPSTVF